MHGCFGRAGGVHVNMTMIARKLKGAGGRPRRQASRAASGGAFARRAAGARDGPGLGYRTHMLGKWHAGQSSADLVPAGRGFDTSLGYLNGAEDHWSQARSACGVPTFVDLYKTDAPAVGLNGTCKGRAGIAGGAPPARDR